MVVATLLVSLLPTSVSPVWVLVSFGAARKVACVNLWSCFLQFATGNNDLTDTLVRVRLNIMEMAIGFQRSTIDAECGEGADLSCSRFEDEEREGIAEGLRILCNDIGRAGQVVDDSIQERLYADIFGC